MDRSLDEDDAGRALAVPRRQDQHVVAVAALELRGVTTEPSVHLAPVACGIPLEVDRGDELQPVGVEAQQRDRLTMQDRRDGAAGGREDRARGR